MLFFRCVDSLNDLNLHITLAFCHVDRDVLLVPPRGQVDGGVAQRLGLASKLVRLVRVAK
jgi:hypothetical protein